MAATRKTDPSRTLQPGLFSTGLPLPEGFKYRPELVSADSERLLVEQLRELAFEPFEFQGYVGKRRVLSYGWRYDFKERLLRKAADLPPFLLPLRDLAAAFARLSPSELSHVLITEYAGGAGIGWHRDKGVFGDVVGISLLSPCRFRFRRKREPAWERVTLTLEPRSAYLLTGPSRTEWEHSIPETEELRYSITFRTLRS